MRVRETENNQKQNKMKVSNICSDMTPRHTDYQAPAMEVVEINVERGFELSGDGFTGPSYGEEDVEW